MVDGMRATLYAGCETLEVVGESHRQGNLWAIVGCEPTNDRVRHDCHAILVAEYDNPHDHNAISVWIDRHLVGYLSREDAADYRPGLLKLFERGPVALAVTIGGGGYGGQALLGVFLDHDPADFGVNAAPSPPRQLRTGLSDAFITDRFDDSYDLSRRHELPEDIRRAVTKLRQLLEHHPDPIDRHFMFCELETRLYRLRDSDPTALAAYDHACRAHDAEMIAIRPALFEKFGKIPLLETYKQQAIRQQRAKNWTEGLQWAEQGIALYGEDAARPDWIADLRKRAALFRAKLDNSTPVTTTPAPRGMTATVASVEALTCARCGIRWQRFRTRGRKPLLWEVCRAGPQEA
jgi:hypothetical protein